MFSDLNQIALETFAEPFTLKKTGGDVALRGVFGDSTDPNAVASAGYADRQYSLALADIDAAAIGLRATVTVRGVDYQVVDRDVDLSGMITLTLRRY
jgi:hypothetical protein